MTLFHNGNKQQSGITEGENTDTNKFIGSEIKDDVWGEMKKQK